MVKERENDLPRIISKKELKRIIPYTPQHILRLEKQGKFPKRIQVGERRVGWLLSDVESWIESRMTCGATPSVKA